MSKLELSEAILSMPIPHLDRARDLRAAGYDDVPLDLSHPLVNDPLIGLEEYGIASQSYYSRKNSTGDPVPGVRPEVLVRRDVAERLVRVNEFLSTAEFVIVHCGGPVELFVDDGLRSVGLIQKIYDEIYPNYLRERYPKWSEEAILAERDNSAAKPSEASPHASGGVVDAKLRLKENKAHVGYGRVKKVRDTVRTDYYETHDGPDDFRQNRRLVFHAMAAVGLVNNPMEVWHYGRGDRLSHVVSPAVMPGGSVIPAYYAAVEGAPELIQ